VNTNKGVKWRRFIMSKKVEQINDYLFIGIDCLLNYPFIVTHYDLCESKREVW